MSKGAKRQAEVLYVAFYSWVVLSFMFSAISVFSVVAWHYLGAWSLCIAPVLAAFGAVHGTLKAFGSDW